MTASASIWSLGLSCYISSEPELGSPRVASASHVLQNSSERLSITATPISPLVANGCCSLTVDEQCNRFQTLDDEALQHILSRLHGRVGFDVSGFLSLDLSQGWASLTNPSVLSALVRACGDAKDLSGGKLVHKHILHLGLIRDGALANCIIRMYGKCGALEEAWWVFSDFKHKDEFTWSIMLRACLECGSLKNACTILHSTPERSVLTWNAVISAHAQKGRRKEALHLYKQMLSEMVPDKVTFISVLSACCSEDVLAQGKQIHAHVMKCGLELDCMVINSLQNMYGKCGSVEHARRMFDKTVDRDMFSWNTMISVYAQHGRGKEALEILSLMQSQGVIADHVSYVGLLDACARDLNLNKGVKMHLDVVRGGFESDVIVGTALVNMYGKCRSLEGAQIVFMRLVKKDLVAWNAMIEAYAENEHYMQAFELYKQMQLEGFRPDSSTFLSLLSSCATGEALHIGKQAHKEVQCYAFGNSISVKNALINMYSKCGTLDESWAVFSEMLQHDVVSWNIMIMAFADHGEGEKALELFRAMQHKGFTPDRVTILGALDACASHNVLADGKLLHASISHSGIVADKMIGSALIKMYSKCGHLEDARKVFDNAPDKDIIFWNLLIAVYGQYGKGEKALEIYRQMKAARASPNESTFASVLSACTHGGLFQDGRSCFSSMTEEYEIKPNLEHCNIMIDLLGRTGHITDAEDFINNMSVKTNATSFLTLLSACREHFDIERGTRVAECLLQVSPDISGPYVLFANLCAGHDDEYD